MYDWRNMSPQQREETLRLRKQLQVPWHSPPHRAGDRKVYHITAACYKHCPVIGQSLGRMASFSQLLLETLTSLATKVYAWCVLRNHYHVLVQAEDVKKTLWQLGRMHGRTSFEWNRDECRRGRKVWCNAVERSIRSYRHHWATVNYIHHNPVHHGYVKRWQDWAFSSVASYLEAVGEGRAAEIWEEYPVLDYGKGWDDPNL